MPRPPRILIDDGCYHILTRGNNRAVVFHQDTDRQRYLQWLLTFSREHSVAIYHYCLMTNHVHLVVRASQGVGIRQTMQRLNLTYAKYLRQMYGHVGHVWQDRFKSLLIADDSHLLQCGGYVELNPVRAKMVDAPSAYPWSSCRAYVEGRDDPLVTWSPAYLSLGATLTQRQVYYRQFLRQQVQPLPANWFQQTVLGTVEQRAGILRRVGLSVHTRPRGRPRNMPKPSVDTAVRRLNEK